MRPVSRDAWGGDVWAGGIIVLKPSIIDSRTGEWATGPVDWVVGRAAEIDVEPQSPSSRSAPHTPRHRFTTKPGTPHSTCSKSMTGSADVACCSPEWRQHRTASRKFTGGSIHPGDLHLATLVPVVVNR